MARPTEGPRRGEGRAEGCGRRRPRRQQLRPERRVADGGPAVCARQPAVDGGWLAAVAGKPTRLCGPAVRRAVDRPPPPTTTPRPRHTTPPPPQVLWAISQQKASPVGSTFRTTEGRGTSARVLFRRE